MNGRVAHVCTVDLTARFLLLPQLERLRDEGYEVSVISADGPWVGEIEARGIRHLAWGSATRAWNLRADRRAYRELKSVLGRERFDVVHTHNPKPGVLGRIAARRAGVPVVVNTVHGLYATPEDPWPKRAAVLAAERYAARFSDLELYQSAEDLAWARRERVVPQGRSMLLGNGTDVERFSPHAVPEATIRALRQELGIPPEATVVGVVGRLVAEKGFRELFLAMRSVAERHPGTRLLVVGSSDADKDDSLSQEEVAAAGPHVVAAGWRPDVRDLYALMDVFVLPSWREGVPRSAIEAAAMGRPLVLTNIRGCREVARDGREGLLVPPRSPEDLAAAIGRLVGDPRLRRTMGRAARERAVDLFDERKVMDRIVDAYADSLTRKGLRPASGEGFSVRPARKADAPVLARMHAEALPDAFLPRLGPRFMRRLYQAMMADPGSVVLVAEGEGRVVGFASGVTSVGAFYRRFARRHGLLAGAAAAPRLFRPSVLRRVRETARYPAAAGALPDAELLSIAVHPRWRDRGVGGVLGRGIVEALAARGAEQVKVVVGTANLGANRFYERIGFRPVRGMAVHEGIDSTVLVIPCGS